ncbi:MAG TPA: hypothetical protein VEV44_17215 [Pseudoneobacillus sp.]|nr:hypothetical protein [Pseudoneobacillus sp.]
MNKPIPKFILLFSIFLSGTNSMAVFANSKNQEKPPKRICIEEYKKLRNEFDNLILLDIVDSFDLDLSGYQELRYSDLNLRVGGNIKEQLDKISLQHMFVGASLGERRLFLESGLEGTEGYLLYKRIDGNNVLKKLHKTENIWVVMSEDEVKADRYKFGRFDWNKCQDN